MRRNVFSIIISGLFALLLLTLGALAQDKNELNSKWSAKDIEATQLITMIMPRESKSIDKTASRSISGQGEKIEKSRITEITLERQGCFGPCPIYKVILRSDNTFTYIGKQNVTHIGESSGSIYFDRIAKWVETQGFFNMKNKYAEGWADAEVVVTTAVRDGERKSVTTYNSGEPPVELWAINAVIDGEISRGMQRIKR